MARRKRKRRKQGTKPLQRDRAFRALTTESPEIIPKLLVALGIAPPGSEVAIVDNLATGLDPPPARLWNASHNRLGAALRRDEPLRRAALPRMTRESSFGRATHRRDPSRSEHDLLEVMRCVLDVDLVVRISNLPVHHFEWQGWPDPGFRDRTLRYHLLLVVRDAPTPVRTVVIWSRVPSAEEIAPYRLGQIEVAFDHIILAHQDPERLLADPATACFAMACRTDDPEGLAVRVVEALQGAPPRAAVVAALAAAAVGSYVYEVFRSEWERRGMEPIIIEELARMLEDRGREQGRLEGAEQGRREGAEQGRREGAEQGRREGAELLRGAVRDMAELCGVDLDDSRRAWIASASLAELDAVRISLMRDRAWPR